MEIYVFYGEFFMNMWGTENGKAHLSYSMAIPITTVEGMGGGNAMSCVCSFFVSFFMIENWVTLFIL